MTPIETPQSSEELTSKENDTPPLPGESNDGSIHVRNVGELNEDNNDDNEAESAPFSAVPVKRRCLPSWMLSTPNKKQKQHSGNSQNPESSPSTSSAHAVADSDNTDDSSNQNNAETSCDTTSTTKNSEINKNNEIKDEKIIQALINEVKSLKDDEGTVDAGGIDDIASSSNQTPATSNVKIKTEPQDDDPPTVGQITPSSSNDIKPAIKVEKEEATSSTTRNSCKFGIRCYRQNPMHRQEEAHPGDSDYRRPDFPPPPDDAPPCPYGDLCYRRNPVHFQQFTHPPSTDFKQNWKIHQMRLRERKQKQQQSQKDETGSDVDESEDFYDSSEEYKIGDELDEDDDDDEDDFY